MQERNNYTKIEDFLSDQSFRQWVEYHVDQQKWEEWTLEDSKRAKLVEEARLWLLSMKVTKLTTDELNVEFALEKTWEKINNLEKIVKELENGDVALDDAINKFNEAIKLANSCNKTLEEATKTVNKVLNKEGNLEDFEKVDE